ncbi:type II secretion system protein [Enterovibrio coralii]|uniref:MSHA biogenesis protein MshA n=1 Tax=Enterovibrio coralii TaxID=294935 RepID=A0A135I3K4_9GAMM|nr:type II secretion system protein [Enterovibrio coralii]KXF80030.1 hypothetical protein ATN88_13425 [Enterovibrio coralii]
MKRQGGFTLIEMIVVIVILGILSVTAAPKFLSFKDDAQAGALEGLKAAMQSAASIVNGSFLISGADANSKVGDVLVHNGFPDATSTGIGEAIETADFEPYTTGSTPAGSIEYTFVEGGGTKCVIYTKSAALNVNPVIAVGDCTK